MRIVNLILIMIIACIVCRSSSIRNFRANLWLAVQKTWSWNARVIVESSKRIMNLSWILHDYQNWARKQVEAQKREVKKWDEMWEWEKRMKESESTEEDVEESKQSKRVKKNFFLKKQERANLFLMIECEWFDQALIEKRWNLQTVTDVERKSIVQLMLSSVERFFTNKSMIW